MKTKTLYTIISVLVVALLLTSVGVTYYFYQDQESSASSQRYADELGVAIAQYRMLSTSFNASLADYNRTLYLLANAISNLNTSTPSYRQGSAALSYLWNSYEALARVSGRSVSFEVRMLVAYDNGTRRWYNASDAQPGWNAYVTTVALLGGQVQATWYPQYGEHLISGIGGRNQTSSISWFLWVYSGGAWVPSQTGADQLRLDNGTTLAWTLCGYDVNFNPSCSP